MNFYLQLKLASLDKISFLQIQRRIFQPILQYLIQCNNQIIKKDIKRVGSKTFPPKYFVLNFKNTNFSFLQPQKVKVNISIGKTQTSFMRFGTIPQISMNFGRQQPVSVLYSTLQHEVLHVIQYLIRDYRRYILNHKIYPSGGLGGLVKKQYRNNKYDDTGRLINQEGKTTGTKRTQHTLRPVQHYTDLNSIVRELQLFYIHNQSLFPSKKQFLKKFFNNQIYFLNHWFNTLNQYKSINNDLYLSNMKKIYDQFMNKPWPFTKQQILSFNNKNKQLLLNKQQTIEKPKLQKLQQDQNIVVAHGLDGTEITLADFAKINKTPFQFDALDLSNLYDDNTDEVNRLIRHLPYIRQVHTDHSGFKIKMSLPDGFNSLIKFLTKAKQLRQRQTQLDVNGNKNIDNLVKQVVKDICVQVYYYKRLPNYTSNFKGQDLLQKYYY